MKKTWPNAYREEQQVTTGNLCKAAELGPQATSYKHWFPISCLISAKDLTSHRIFICFKTNHRRSILPTEGERNRVLWLSFIMCMSRSLRSSLLSPLHSLAKLMLWKERGHFPHYGNASDTHCHVFALQWERKRTFFFLGSRDQKGDLGLQLTEAHVSLRWGLMGRRRSANQMRPLEPERGPTVWFGWWRFPFQMLTPTLLFQTTTVWLIPLAHLLKNSLARHNTKSLLVAAMTCKKKT